MGHVMVGHGARRLLIGVAHRGDARGQAALSLARAPAPARRMPAWSAAWPRSQPRPRRWLEYKPTHKTIDVRDAGPRGQGAAAAAERSCTTTRARRTAGSAGTRWRRSGRSRRSSRARRSRTNPDNVDPGHAAPDAAPEAAQGAHQARALDPDRGQQGRSACWSSTTTRRSC